MKSKYYLYHDNRNIGSIVTPIRVTRYVNFKTGLVVDKFYYFKKFHIRIYRLEEDPEVPTWYKCTYLETVRKGTGGEAYCLNYMEPYEKEELIIEK